MKKALFLLVAMLFAVQPQFAQAPKKSSKSSREKAPEDFEFIKGGEIKERKLSIGSSLAGYDGNNAYLVGFRPVVAIIGFVPVTSMKFVFQSYNTSDMSLDKAYRANAFTKQFKKNRFFAADMINDEPYMFTYENVKSKSGKEGLAINYYSIDKTTMKPGAKSKLVEVPKASIRGSRLKYVMGISKGITGSNSPTPGIFGLSRNRASGVTYLRSPDKKIFYLVSIFEDGTKSSKTSTADVHIYAYDTNMDQLWEKSDKVKFDDWQSTISGIDADNIGNVYFTVKNYDKKLRGESKKGGVANYTYQLYYINKDVEDLKSIKLDLDNKFVTEMAVKVYDDSLGAICTGFYYDNNSKRKDDKISGSFLAVVDNENDEMLDENFYEFDDNFYTQNVKIKTLFALKKGKAEKKGAEDVVLRNVYVRPDGNVVLTGERYYMIAETTTSTSASGATSSRTKYHYYHKDIVATCVTPAGATQWTVRIPKFQHQINSTALSSFKAVLNGNDLYFVYNDHTDNSKLTTDGVFSWADLAGKNNSLVAVKVSAEGEVDKYKLSTKNELGGFVCVQAGINIENKKLILPVMNRWGRLLKYAEMDFKKPKE